MIDHRGIIVLLSRSPVSRDALQNRESSSSGWGAIQTCPFDSIIYSLPQLCARTANRIKHLQLGRREIDDNRLFSCEEAGVSRQMNVIRQSPSVRGFLIIRISRIFNLLPQTLVRQYVQISARDYRNVVILRPQPGIPTHDFASRCRLSARQSVLTVVDESGALENVRSCKGVFTSREHCRPMTEDAARYRTPIVT